MPTATPYHLADLTITQINKRTLRRFMRVRQKMISGGFDELNVINSLDSLYKALREDARNALHELWMLRYLEAWKEYNRKNRKNPDEDELDDLVDMHLAKLLEEPNPVTRYIYETEIQRKRDRAKESIDAAPTISEKKYEIDKAMRYWVQMNKWYADFTAQDAEVQALKDLDAEAVMRHELDDTRTCSTCRDADGDIYPINKIPPLPHPGCRRWFTPVWNPKI